MSHPARRRARPAGRSAGGTLVGVFIGIVLGIALAAAVALYVTGGWKAYQTQVSGGSAPRSDPARQVAKGDAKPEPDKPRFDFYKILPSGEDAKVAPAKPAGPDKAAPATTREPVKPGEKLASVEPGKEVAKAPDRFWLQAGSFLQEADAENLKARLALAGWEAQVQAGTLPDRGVRYRVRLGPYDNTDELNRIRAELSRRGFDVAVIRQ